MGNKALRKFELKNEINVTDIHKKYFAECIEKGEIPTIEKAAADIKELQKRSK